MLARTAFIALALASLAGSLSAETGATLRGSPASMQRQNSIAHQEDYSFLRTAAQLRDFVDHGYLVPVKPGANLALSNVSHPYARPEVQLFLGRLAAEYHSGCGERLVVTSLTRPRSEQPWNSHPLSVHPTGMAADLRVSSSGACRAWLEGTLLSLEKRGLLDVTREHHPSHYHVALFTDAYATYVRNLLADSTRNAPAVVQATLAPVTSPLAARDEGAQEETPNRTHLPRALAAALVLAAGLTFVRRRGLAFRRRRSD